MRAETASSIDRYWSANRAPRRLYEYNRIFRVQNKYNSNNIPYAVYNFTIYKLLSRKLIRFSLADELNKNLIPAEI